MSKQPSSAKILVADGRGGMRTVEDHRFDEGGWSISFAVSPEDAKTWMSHLDAECESRGWQYGGLSQLEPEQNSGSMTLRAPTVSSAAAAIEIAWEKGRDERLSVRARPGALSKEAARDFFSAIDVRLRNRTTLRQHCRAWLTYGVLPWRGELWLGGDLRLGPPSQYPDAIYGPQIVVVDAMVEGIGSKGVTEKFQRTLFELRVFLSAVLGDRFDEMKPTYGWAYEVDQRGQITCRLTTLGYAETQGAVGFPATGSAPPIEHRIIGRPGIGKLGVTFGITLDMTERWVPDDIESLWGLFLGLPNDKRDQFMKAGNAYLIGATMWPEQPTAYASFLVVTCEALKPRGRRYHGMNVYDVVESLVGAGRGAALRAQSVAPQRVRSEHFHRGDLLAGELDELLIADPFHDPSFRNMLDLLGRDTRVCLIEWLRQKGEYKVARLPRTKQPFGWFARARKIINHTAAMWSKR
jgi:hypothetical protein